MSNNLSIIKLFCNDRTTFTKYYGYIKTISNLERELKIIFDLVESYYDEYSDTPNISYDDLIVYYNLKNPVNKDKQFIIELMGRAFNIDANPELVKTILDQILERYHATQIVNKLIPVVEDETYAVLHTIKEDVDKYIEQLHHPPPSLQVPEPCKISLNELVETEIENEGIPWHLSGITEYLGGVKSRTHGLIYAYVDTGKTSFAFSGMAKFAKMLAHTDQNIVYAGNEENSQGLLLRFYQALLGKNRDYIQKNKDECEEQAKQFGIDRVNIFSGIIHTNQIQYLLKEYKPTIFFIDQATNVEMPTKKRVEGVAYLQHLFEWYRNAAEIHDCAVIGTSQGTGEAEKKKFLDLSDVYGSRVGIQGALDYAIGIGRDMDKKIYETERYINISKNKLHEGKKGRFVVTFNHTTCQWRMR